MQTSRTGLISHTYLFHRDKIINMFYTKFILTWKIFQYLYYFILCCRYTCVCAYAHILEYVCIMYLCRPYVNTGCFPPLHPSNVFETRSFSKMGTSWLINWLTSEAWNLSISASKHWYYRYNAAHLALYCILFGKINLIMKKVTKFL